MAGHGLREVVVCPGSRNGALVHNFNECPKFRCHAVTDERSAAFVAIGLIPQNEIVANLVKLNDYGYVDADESCVTDAKGIFVAGDCRSKKIRQVATAASDGAIAALAACDYIENL